MARLFAQHIATEDLVFTGEDFARQWQECGESLPRQNYAYVIPFPDDPTWPELECYFSSRAFTKRELRQLCQYDYSPLHQRTAQGVQVLGFKWALDQVKLTAATEAGERIVRTINGGAMK